MIENLLKIVPIISRIHDSEKFRIGKNYWLKIALLAAALFFLPQVAHAFTCTAVAGGGNWGDAATWSGCNSTFPQAGDDVVLDATSGNVVVNANTNALKSFVMTGYTGTLSGASSISVRGLAGGAENVIFDGTITWTGGLVFTSAATADINLTTNGKLLNSITLNGSSNSTTTLQDNLSFSAVKTNVLTLGTGTGSMKLDMNGKTISGNSTTNRILVQTAAIGTQRQIFRNSGVFANADFRDIDFESSYDCSAITGLCGDAGGNSADFTFTSATTLYLIANGNVSWSGNVWSTSSGGSVGARVPLPQDDVIMDDASFNGANLITCDMPRLGHTIDASAYTEAQGPALRAGTATTLYGSYILSSGMGSNINIAITFSGRSGSVANGTSTSMPAAGWKIQSSGVQTTSGATTISSSGGTYQLQDAMTTNGTFNVAAGTFDANDFNVTHAATVFTSGGPTTNAGNGTWTVTTTGNAWTMGTSHTWNAEGSTVVVSNTAAGGKNFAGGTRTYNTVTFTGQNITVTGSNTFTTFNLNTAGLTIGTKFTAGTTQTITNFSSNGTAGNLVYASSTSATNATWDKAGGGTVCEDYLYITDITGSPASTWYAENSTDGGDNTNWTFSACPGGGGGSTAATSSVRVKGGFKVKGGVKFR